MNGLIYLIADDDTRTHLPRYFVYGAKSQPTTLAEYRKALKATPGNSKVVRFAERTVSEKLGRGDVLHHTPFLTWNVEGM